MAEKVTEEIKEEVIQEKTFYDSTPSMFRNKPFLYMFSFAATVIGIFGLIIWFMHADSDRILFVTSVAGMILGVIGFGILFFWWLEIINTRLTVTNERITFRVGILSKNIREVFLSDIRSVQINQRFLQRIFGTGLVEIASAASSDAEISIDGIPDAYEVKRIIDEHRRRIQAQDSDDKITNE